MAISQDTIWEVRTGGNDTNGGGFVVGSTGTDWSQQTSPQYSVTNGVTNGTTTITSATASFGTDVVGNLIYVQGGTGSITAAWYQIMSRTNSTTIVVDRTTGLTTGTGVTLHIGGCLATLIQLGLSMTSGNRAFIKADGTYTQTASAVFNGQSVSPTGNTPPTWIEGYTTTRGDGGRVSIVLSTNTGLVGIRLTNGNGWRVENFDINCSSLGTSFGISSSSVSYCTIRNVKVSNYTQGGIQNSGSSADWLITQCEVTGGGSSAIYTAIQMSGLCTIEYCWVHDNTAVAGIGAGIGATVCYNLVTNNTGATTDGISVGQGAQVYNNTIYGSGRDGISNNSSAFVAPGFRNNIIANSGRYGIWYATQAVGAVPENDGNVYFNNATANRFGMDNTTTSTWTAAPYTNVSDVTCTSTPFNNSSANDYTLNNVASGGMLARNLSLNCSTVPGVNQQGSMQAGCFPVKYPAYKFNRHTRRRINQ